MDTHCNSRSPPLIAIPRTAMSTFIVGLLALLVCATASAGNKARFVSIDVPGAVATGCFSDCSVIINNWGEVTGSYLDANDVFHGFVRSPDGKLTPFDDPEADTTAGNFNGTFPNAINDAGVITGYYVDVNGASHGFLRSPEGGFTTVDLPGFSNTTPNAINLEGAVAGYTLDATGVFNAFVRTPNGKFQTWIGPGACDETPANGCYGSAAFSINLFGIIAGGFENNTANFVDFGYLRSPSGKFTIFSAPGAGTGSYQGTNCPGCSVALNQFGVVAGVYIDAEGTTHGYLRHPWGEISPIDVAGEGSYGLGCSADCSIGLNDRGAVTSSYLDKNNVYHGFVRSPDGKISTFDAPGADTMANDYNGTFPVSINNQGVIVGSYYDAGSNAHAFILYP